MVFFSFKIVGSDSNVLQHFWRCQSTAWGWGRGTPGNQSKLNYLSADNDKNISFLSSSQNVCVGGWGVELKA